MKVTKQMLHEDLRAYFRPLSAFAAIGKYKPTIQLMNALSRLSKGKNI
ncbi:hypothetical protein HBA55_35170, partial [Pseudomaricurvus alkylphenolicus]|nr:hypothetical protein [Pseudomaricurvus alkylphenolicus]NIB44873.1 hypothetical protein [Pseudomaricurvus alkylphenolicus]